ncbi:universal stress protein [Hyphomonas sp.]|uniref:universal stress protein n=1 Tax=Hyphomonas sp. TaxID=87 RepID=UPI00391BDF8B
MQLRDILVCVTSATQDTGAIALAQRLKEATGAHVACAGIGILPSALLYNEYGAGAAYAEQLNQDKLRIERFWSDLKTVLDRQYPDFEVRRQMTYSINLEALIAAMARHGDLTVIRAPAKESPQPHAEMIEAALLGSGRPVMVVPADWKGETVGTNVVAGWDASREAARALHDALMVLPAGATVTIVTVDVRPGGFQHGDTPGIDIAAHLARHGLKVVLRNEASLGQSKHEVLLRVATDIDADLMVLGGYRHSRLQQALFGGVTRSMLREAHLPLLLSH